MAYNNEEKYGSFQEICLKNHLNGAYIILLLNFLLHSAAAEIWMRAANCITMGT